MRPNFKSRARPKPGRPKKKKTRRGQYPDLATYIARTHDTQEQIARHLHLSQPTISRIVNADVVPAPGVALRLAAYANVPLDSFLRTFFAKHGFTRRRSARKVA